MEYRFRRFRESDAARLCEITQAAILAVGPHRYSAEQVAAWASKRRGPERFVDAVAEGATIWIAADPNDIAVAYALLKMAENSAGHLDLLYCHPNHTRRGLADTLLAQAEDHARHSGLARLTTEASELARPAFARAGYRMVRRRDFAVEGVAIHNYAMEKPLD